MIDIVAWMHDYAQIVHGTFPDRVAFIGLQGSYGRGEATTDSDIDVVLILDHLSIQDLSDYDAAVSQLPHREKLCGFVSGKQELSNWETSDVFQFYHDTTPIYGNLDALLPPIEPEDVRRAIKFGACNIYHACVHNLLHDKDLDLLHGLYKSAGFVLQAKYYYHAGRYVKHMQELCPLLPPDEREIIYNRSCSGGAGLEALSEPLLTWASGVIKRG